MKFQVVFLFCLSMLVGCSPTVELQNARLREDATVREYSPLSGYSKRVGSFSKVVDEENKRSDEVPSGMVASYSPLTGKMTFIPKNDGQEFERRRAAPKVERVISYSPLTGDTSYITKPSVGKPGDMASIEMFETEG